MAGGIFKDNFDNQRFWIPNSPRFEEYLQIMLDYHRRFRKRNLDEKKFSVVMFIYYFFERFGSKSIENAVENIRYY